MPEDTLDNRQSQHRYGSADVRAISRRMALGILFGTLISLPFHRYLSRPHVTLVDRLGSADAKELLGDMFGRRQVNVPAALLLGRSDYQAGLHPDNAAAGAVIRAPLGFASADEETRDLLDVVDKDEVVLVGGTSSNKLTMIAWEASGPDMDRLSRPEERGEAPIIPLRWFGSGDRFDPDVQSLGPVGWRMEEQGFVSTVNWIVRDTMMPNAKPICAERSNGTVLDKNGNLTHQLLTNHLIVTRVPNYLHPNFGSLPREEWPYLVLFQGMHGIGTRAVELLLTGHGLPVLEEAAHKLNGAREYQLLFEVGDVGEIPDGYGDVFHACRSIQLKDYDILRGRVNDADYVRAHGVAVRRLRQKQPWLP